MISMLLRLADATGHPNCHSGADPDACRLPSLTTRARNATERDTDWLKDWRRAPTRYDKYAHRYLGCLVLV